MKKLLLAFTAIMLSATVTFANSYTANDNAIDGLFDDAIEMNYDNLNAAAAFNMSNMDITEAQAKSEWAAVVICWFLGGLGVHRWYLGSSMGTYIGYCFLGWCLGWIDFWIIAINGIIKGNGVGQYENNDSLFMWK